MKIKNADELIMFLKTYDMLGLGQQDTIYLNKHLYELLIEKDWDCPLGTKLKNAIFDGLQVYKD